MDMKSVTHLVLAGVAGRGSGDPETRHTVCQHYLLLRSFVVFPPSYAPVKASTHELKESKHQNVNRRQHYTCTQQQTRIWWRYILFIPFHTVSFYVFK